MVKTYPSFTKRYVKKRLAMVEGWQWYAFAVIDDPMNKFGGIKPSGGYVAQESEKLVKQAHESWQHQS